MPIYEYLCNQCGKLIDVLQKLSDPPPMKCENCGAEGPLTKCVSRTSFVLKGGGWYSDLYGSSKKESGGGGGTTKAETSSTTSATPAATTGTTTSTSTAAPAAASTSTGSDKK